MSLSKPQIINTAACPTCCAYKGEQCKFSSGDDPHLLRTVAKQSHLARLTLARKIVAENKENAEKGIDEFVLFL
jgi:hypothetical protein